MVSRRTLLKLPLLGSMLAALPALEGCGKPGKTFLTSAPGDLASKHPHVAEYLAKVTTRPKRPNILIMVLDDAGWGDLPAYGNRIAITPNIDRLAQEGIKFEAFHSGSPVCGPSRICLFSGQHPAKIGINTNPNEKNWRERLNKVQYVDADTPCLTSVFKAAGYQTGFFGKSHLGADSSSPSMLARGIDRFFGWSCNQSDSVEYRNWANFSGIEEWPAPMLSVHKSGKNDEIRLIDEKTTAEALRFMQSASSPWFVQLNFNTPHTPLDPRPEDRDAIRKGKPFWSRSDEPAWSPDQMYYGSLLSLDKRCIGPLLAWLDSSGQREDTIIILTSDNGAMRPFNPSESAWASGFNGGYSGWKAQLDLGAIRIPFIVSWPGVLASNAVSKQIGYFADVLPTLAYLTGVKVPNPQELDGENIAHALVSTVTLNRQAPIYYYYPQIGAEHLQDKTPTLSMLTPDGNWYFQCDAPKIPGQEPYRPALYKVTEDPGQTLNLYDPNNKEERGEMSRLLPAMLLAWAEKHLPPGWEDHRTSGGEGGVRLSQPKDAAFPVK